MATERENSILSHIPLADTLAARFSASHPEISSDDFRAEALYALLCAVDNYRLDSGMRSGLAGHISRVVKTYLTALADKQRRYSALVRNCQQEEDLELASDKQDLRRVPVSLCPPADLFERSPRMVEDIGDIRGSAVIQCNRNHLRHRRYLREAALNRGLVQEARTVRSSRLAQRLRRAAPAVVPPTSRAVLTGRGVPR